MKLYFTQNENRFERGKTKLLIEDIGFGMESVAIEKAHKLLLRGEITLLTGLISSKIGVQMGKMPHTTGLPTLSPLWANLRSK